MHLLTSPKLIAETRVDLDRARELVRGQPLYERRLQGVIAGHEFAAGIGQVLQIKKKTGTKVEIVGLRGSFLKSPQAESAFTQLLVDTQQRNASPGIFDMLSGPPYFYYLDGDVLRNDALGYQHEHDLLSDF